MDETFMMTLHLHSALVGITLIFAAVNYFIINNKLDYDGLVKRFRGMLPFYYLALATVIFTGLVLLGLARFNFQYSELLMIVVWFIILISTIKRYKKFKSLRRDDTVRLGRFIKFSKRKHLIDMALIIITMAVAYM
ncbi:hypothetical protein [Sulfurospirillum sp. 1612]|uniref:hypothetical protein n=1 Tax=Sulfurospirillum sp. 1612 TaxID=3094835 RepID=UPI002F94D141